MRKRRKIALAGLTALAAACLAAGCAAAKGYEFDYEQYVPETEQDYTLDDGVVIDGVADETFWEGLTPLSFTDPESGITMTSWAYIGENGLYLYAQSTDRSVFFSTEKEFYQNDEMEFMIDPRPEYSRSDDGLDEGLRTDCLQIRIDSQGRQQRYFGRQVSADAYPWATGYYSLEVAAVVNGTLNEANGAQGYGVEAFVAWDAMGLSEKPDSVGVMPAFNNTDTASDTGRKWFTYKGMSHSTPSSYAVVDETGFQIIANDFELSEPLDLNADDYADATVAQVIEVTQENTGDAVRGEMRARLGEDGIYFYAVVHDKALTRYSSSVWSNDGIELYIDTLGVGGSSRFREGILRIGVDIDEGYAAFVFSEAQQVSYASHRKMFVVTNVAEYAGEETAFSYRYTYEYEIMIPYESLGLSGQPNDLSFGWAIKSPNELAYTKDRMSGGALSASDWLYANGHSPYVPSQYYRVYERLSEVALEVDNMQGVVGYYTAIFPKFLNGAQEEGVSYSVAAADSAKVEIVGNKLYPKEVGQYTVTATTASGITATFTLNALGTDDSLIAESNGRSLDAFRERLQFIVARQEAFTFEQDGLTLFIGDSFMDDGLFFTDFYTRYGADNANILGISSSFAAQWVYYAQEALYPYAPDQVVVHLGTNDIGYQTDTQVIATLTYMFDSFHDALPDTTFWWWTIEQHVGWSGNYKAVAVNAAMREYAQDKDWLKIVDSYSAVSNADGTPNESMYLDGVHLTAEGYAAVLSVMDGMGFAAQERTNTQLVSFDGEGTQESPFLIGTADDLLRFSAAVTSKLGYTNTSGTHMYAAAYYRLEENIDLSGIHFPAIGRCTTGGSHIYDLDVAFTGSFDGNGKTISNLSMRSQWGTLGLFGNAIGARIYDLKLENVSLTAGDMRVGGLIGRAQDTSVENITVSGEIEGTESVGGIIGIISGGACTVAECTNYAALRGTLYGTGGIVGDNLNAGFTISNCSNYAQVSGSQAGGIIGVMRSGGDKSIVGCYNYGDIAGTTAAGGIASNNLGTIENSYCLDAVTLTVDGAVQIVAQMLSFIGVEQSAGIISASGTAPKSCGTVDSDGIKSPLVSVTVEASGATVEIVSVANGQVTFSVLPDDGHTYAVAFLGETPLDGMTFAFPSQDMTLTVICNMNFGGGSGTQEDPFILSAAGHLASLAQAVNGGDRYYSDTDQLYYADAYYVLGADIDLAGVTYSPIGTVSGGDSTTYAFRGTLDGQGYAIRHLTIASSALHTGLFGNAVGATFTDIMFEDVSISVTAMRTGALVGRGYGVNISDVIVSSGSISGTESVGGIVGIMVGTGNSITDCENHASISGTLYGSGGIVGDTSSGTQITISGCSNYGAVSCTLTTTGTYNSVSAGGIIGVIRSGSTSVITGCYNYGNISAQNADGIDKTNEAGGIAGGNVGTMENCYTLSTVTIALEGAPQAANTLPETGSAASAYAGYLAGRNTGTITGGGLCDAQGGPVAIVITLSLDADGGTLPEGTAATISVAHGAAAGSLPAPTRTGFRFDGWYEGDTLVTADTVYYAPARTVTLTAHWVEQVNVTFDAGDGSFAQGGSMLVMTIDKGSSISELPAATRVEYALVGWYDGDTLVTTATTFDSNTTLTAQWESSPTYTLITFNVNGGTYTDEEQQTSIQLPVGDRLGTLPEATYAGHRLIGWFTAEGTQVNADSTFSVSAVTLTAHWQKVTEVTFVAPYGGSLAESTRLVDEGQPLGDLPQLTLLAGNELIGWYDENGQAVTSDSTFTADAVTLTARDGWDGTTASTSLAGEGTESSPYQITSGADLRYIRDQTLAVSSGGAGNSFSGSYFILLTDVHLNEKAFSPIGRGSDAPFSGNLNGNGKTIDGLHLNGNNTDSIGLFGCITSGAVSDLTVVGTILNAKQYAGLLAGIVIGADISGVTVYGSVSGVNNLGGVIGALSTSPSTVTNCINHASVNASSTATASAGGVIGFEATYTRISQITGCINYGAVTASGSYVGGIIGVLRNASASGCYNYGDITGTVNVGGITGDNRADITDSHCASSAQITTSTGTYSAGELEQAGSSGNNYAGYICGYPTAAGSATGCGLCDGDGEPVVAE